MTTPDTSAQPLCNAWGRPFAYQNLADWSAYVSTLGEYDLSTAARYLAQANQGMGAVLFCPWGSDAWWQCRQVLHQRATGLGWVWSSRDRRFEKVSRNG